MEREVYSKIIFFEDYSNKDIFDIEVEKAYSNFVFSEKVTDIVKENGISAIEALKLNNDIMLKIDDSYFMVFEWLEGRILKAEEKIAHTMQKW